MIITPSITNQPIWRTIKTIVEIPKELECLRKLAYNVWWSWNNDATELFEKLDPFLYSEFHDNPVKLLNNITHDRFKEIIENEELMLEIKSVCNRFEEYLQVPFEESKTSVAYFSMEYGLTTILKIYSGGLGVLAGDYLKEASDSRVNLCAVGFLYRDGYFAQEISPDGNQISNKDTQDFYNIPIEPVLDTDGKQMILAVPYPDRYVYANVWKVNVGRISLYLLDTDLDLNSEFDRRITNQLYGGDWENRIKQEILLGIGGIHLLNKLGIKKDIYHCNEGHAAFLNVQRLLDLVEKEDLTFNQALEVVRASGLYTVHTPVPAGHDYFDEGLMSKYFSTYPEKLGITWKDFMNLGREVADSDSKFSMSVFALKTCEEANGVSYLHGEISKKMFQPVWPAYFAEELHVSYVTNGVHMPTWATKEMKNIYDKYFPKDWMDHQSNPKMWENIQNVPNETIWKARVSLKRKLANYIQQHILKGMSHFQTDPSGALATTSQINPNALLVGFGRRFATYKRAHLLFNDLKRLERLVNNPDHPIQFLYTGKAHPADGGGQGLIKYIVEISKRPEFVGKILFLENYNMNLAKHLIPGVDIWLNTPTRPLEASGTSGEKAIMNGVVNFSVLDGWYYEGYRKNAGWCLTDKRTFENQEYQDDLDAALIYSTFEKEILPIYYAKNEFGYSPEWLKYVKNTISEIAPHYTMKRMIDDYIERFYKKLAERHSKMIENNYSLPREIVTWKKDVASKWDSMVVVESNCLTSNTNGSLDMILTDMDRKKLSIVMDVKGASGDFGIDCVLSKNNSKTGVIEYADSFCFDVVKREGSLIYFELETKISKPGLYNYGFRFYPKNDNLTYRMDFSYVKWL